MRLELAQKHFDEGWGIFDLGCVMSDAAGAEFEIVRFSGVSEIDDTDGMENENIIVHFADGSAMEFETLDRELINDHKFEPVSPDWFVEEVREHRGEPSEPSEAEQAAEAGSGADASRRSGATAISPRSQETGQGRSRATTD